MKVKVVMKELNYYTCYDESLYNVNCKVNRSQLYLGNEY